MLNFFKNIIFLFILGFFCLVFVFVFYSKNPEVIAGESQNVSGYAWSENYGWVSFNCVDNSSCSDFDYGVTIDPTTLNFSGYAWSDNLGWIDFSGVSLDSSGDVVGSAQILALGAEGELRFDDQNLGVWIDEDGYFHGWAWNSDTEGKGLGWLSFNCSDENNNCTEGVAGDYKVITSFDFNRPPSVTLEESDINYDSFPDFFDNPCEYNPAVYLRWNFDDTEGDSQSEYKIVISKNQDLSNLLSVSGTNEWVDSSAEQFIFNDANINFGDVYYWKVFVRDSGSLEAESQVGKVTFYNHRFPEVFFETNPISPTSGEEFELVGSATKYHSDGSSEECTEDTCEFNWVFPTLPDGSQGVTIVDGINGASSTMKVIYDSDIEDTTTILVVNDEASGLGYECSYSAEIGFILTLPEWIETRP